MKKYYDILGLKENASFEEIENAYNLQRMEWERKLSSKNDAVRQRAENKIFELSKAYNAIKFGNGQDCVQYMVQDAETYIVNTSVPHQNQVVLTQGVPEQKSPSGQTPVILQVNLDRKDIQEKQTLAPERKGWDSKNIVIAVLVAIVVFGGGYYFALGNNKSADIGKSENVHNEIKKDSATRQSAKQVEVPVLKPQDNLLWVGIVEDNDPPMNIRSGPDQSYAIVAKANNGTKVNVVEYNGTWVRVKIDNIEGWCSSKLLRRIEENSGAVAGVSTNPYKRYKNGRYGFYLDIPQDFQAGRLPVNGDGATFWSPNKEAVITVYGSNSPAANNRSTRDEYNEAKRTAANKGQLGYNTVGSDWFVVTYRAGNNIVYVKGLCGRGSANYMRIEYPESKKEMYNSIVEHLESSFKRGNTDISH